MPTWDSHGFALLMLHRSTMEVPNGYCMGNLPCGFYGIGWGLIIGKVHGMALWAMHWDPMDLHWGWSLGLPWKCSMGRSLGCPHGTPMELHCYCSIGAAWKCLMCNTFGNHPCGFYGIGWGLIFGHSMAWLYGQCIGIPWACIGAAH